MARTFAIMAACSWLGVLGGAGAAAEPPAASSDRPPESAEPRPATVSPPADPAVTNVTPATPATDVAAEADSVQPVKEITLDPTAKPPVCRRYVPTGSRIATERCQSAEVADAIREAERDQTRRDIDEMRMRQATRDAARAAQQAEALRRSAGF